MDIKLGQIITGEARRDAVHMAVAPVVAGEALHPGAHVGLHLGKAMSSPVSRADAAIGIVDPFLTAEVRPGETFWLFLYPGSIKGLRHEWIHPEFPEHESVPVVNQESVKWLADFAAGIDMSYEELIDGCKNYLTSGDSIECLKMEWKEPPVGFWVHFQAATGMVVHDEEATPFACCI